MATQAPRGIQATLADYFQDTEYFDLQEANELLLEHQQRDINAESIRARIYEGIEKGLFERVGKGLYTVTRKDEQGKENTCLLINGDRRDLSMFPDNSIDALITDHPYSLKTSLKGGNRNFADYELFQYDGKDFSEKQRVLKQGCFCVEFLPEENGDNYEYLFRVKDMAHKAGLDYYASVPWRKTGFVANTGRKAKNTENIVFFTKGRARDLRPDAKKDKQYQNSRSIVEFSEYIPGSTTVRYTDMGGMGSSSESSVSAVDVNIRLSVDKDDAEKVKEFLEEAWDNAVIYSYEKSPLDKDFGGNFTIEELFDMPVQEYILRYLDSKGISYVDLSPGPKDIFKSGTDVIVNPTNLIGPMGAGLAKEFKERFPGLEETYKESCRQRQFSSSDGFKSSSGFGDEILTAESRALFEGNLFLMGDNSYIQHPAVLCFPTKRDWKDPSDLDLIEAGLKTFVKNYKHLNISSITFPKLGCGLGGLNWEQDVKPLMQKYLGDLPDLKVQICGDTLKVDKRENFMSGAHGMLPTAFDVSPVRKSDKIHQAEKPVELLEQILNFVTLPGETALDQFAGSGVLGEAALNTGRNSVLIEKDVETFQKIKERLEVLGSIEALTPDAHALVSIGSDAIIAQDAFNRTGDRSILDHFAETHDIDSASLYNGEHALRKGASPEQAEAVSKAMAAIEDMDLRSNNLDRTTDPESRSDSENTSHNSGTSPKVLECSSRGDRRFSALYATVTIKDKEQSIEQWYQNAKRTADGKRAGKGKSFDHIIDPFTGDKLPAKDASDLYRGLWITYLSKNPDLVEYASQFDEFHDMFRSSKMENCQADVIEAYVKGDRAHYIAFVKAGHWYKNMASKKKPSLSNQIQSAERKTEEQLSLFNGEPNYRGHWQTSR